MKHLYYILVITSVLILGYVLGRSQAKDVNYDKGYNRAIDDMIRVVDSLETVRAVESFPNHSEILTN